MVTKFFEYKLSYENWNDYYYLCLKFENSTLQNIYKGQLEGLKGISDNISIIHNFFDNPDKILLVMNKTEVNNLNILESVNYFDVDFLVKDNLKVLRRLYNFSWDAKIETMLWGIFYKDRRYNKNKKLITLGNIYFSNKFSNTKEFLTKYGNKIMERISDVTDFDDFVNQIMAIINSNYNLFIEEDSLTEKNIRIALEFAIINSVADYEKEKEMLVKTESFKIPEGSLLIFHGIGEQMYYNQTLFDLFADKLKEKYKIKILPQSNYNQYKLALPIVRYMDKIKTFNQF